MPVNKRQENRTLVLPMCHSQVKVVIVSFKLHLPEFPQSNRGFHCEPNKKLIFRSRKKNFTKVNSLISKKIMKNFSI